MVTRDELFLQTKFTSVNGQDPNKIPYNPRAPLADQVRESFAVSLEQFGTEYLDSLLMHSPMKTVEVAGHLNILNAKEHKLSYFIYLWFTLL